MKDTPASFMDNTRKRFLALLDTQPDLDNKRIFMDLLQAAIQGCGIKPKILCGRFPDIDQSTIYRWIEGYQCPNKPQRPRLISGIREIIEEQLNPSSCTILDGTTSGSINMNCSNRD